MRRFFAIFLLAFFSSSLFAQTLYLKVGKSQTIHTKAPIDTIFISDPAVANYQLLSDTAFILTGKSAGSVNLSVLGKDDKPLMDDIVFVNSGFNDLAHTNEQLKLQFPNSHLRIKRVGQAYVLEGRAKSDTELENTLNLVGAAMGEKPIELQRDVGGMSYYFLNHKEYPNIINNAKLDSSTLINVKLSVVEVNKSLKEELGINWEQPGGNLLQGVRDLRFSDFAFTSSGATSIKFISANGLSGFINALNNEANGKVLAEPNVSMLNGETAHINLGGEIAIPTRDDNNNPSIEYKNYGIRLTVGAKIQPNNRVRIALDQSVSDIVPGTGQFPIISNKSANSIFEIANGESFIIGGLYHSRNQDGLNKVPFLGDLPIIGAFFRQSTTHKEDKELVVVATVNLVHPVSEKDIVYPDLQEYNVYEQFFNTKAVRKLYDRTQVTNFFQRGGFIQ